MNNLSELEEKVAFMQGQIAILFGFVSAKAGKDEFMAYLKRLSEDEKVFENTRKVARMALEDDSFEKRLQHSKPN